MLNNKRGRRPGLQKLDQRLSISVSEKQAGMFVYISDKTKESYSAIVRRLLEKEFKRVHNLYKQQ